MNYHVLTLFPEMILQGLNTSIIGRAIEKGILSLEAKEVLAYETTKIVHGQEEAEKAQVAAKSIFVHGTKSADMPTTTYPKAELEEGKDLITLLVDAKLAKNRSEGRRLIQQGGVTVNDEKITDFARVFTTADFDEEGALVIKKGKKGFHQIKAAE